MAYGAFTGYEPGPAPGSYLFQRANGSPLVFGGPEADQLKARLDAANSATQTAGIDSVGGYGSENTPPSPEQIQGFREQVGGGAPPPAASAPAPEPGGARPFVQNNINTGYVQGPDDRLYERTGGSPGISEKQLKENATKGVATPTSQTDSVTGGFEPNKEYLADKAIAGDAERDAIDRQRGADVAAETAGRDVAREQFIAQSAQLQQQRELVSGIQSEVDAAQARRDQALKDYTGTKVDPERIFSGDFGGVKRVGSAVAAAMGAYAATVGHTQNFAQQIIDNAIARDIQAQEADLRTKKDASDSALGDLVRRGMTLDQAKGTLASIQRDWAKNQMALARGASSNDAINAKYDATIAKYDQQNMDEAEAYRQKALGTAQKSVASKVMYPQAGSAGGLTPVSAAKSLEIAGKSAGTESTVAGTAKTIGEVEKVAGGGKEGNLSNEQKKAIADLRAARAGLARQRAEDEKNGYPTVLTTGTFGGDSSQRLGASANALGPGIARAVEGDAATKDSMDRAVGSLTATSGEVRKKAYEEYEKQLATKERAILEGNGQ